MAAVLLVVGVTSPRTAAASESGPEAVATAAAFESGWRITWNDSLGTPRSVFGGRDLRLPDWSSDHGAAIQEFIDSHAPLFGARPGVDRFEVTREITRSGITHIRTRQTYRGVPVYTGEYAFSVRADGTLSMVTGRFHPRISVDIRPRLSKSAAERAVLGVLRASRDAPASTELVIVPSAGGGALAYEVTSDRFAALVDAGTGAVLSSRDRALHASGWGSVCPTGPCTSSILVADLPRLEGPGSGDGLWRLKGRHVQVFDIAGNNATSSDGVFAFSADSPHFAEVNAYFHADRFVHDFLIPLGCPELLYPITIVANSSASFTRAGVISLRSLSAQLPDNVAHEVAHAICYLVYGLDRDLEGDAVLEGLADYFAAAFTNEPRLLECGGTCGTTGYTWVNSDPMIFRLANLNQVRGCNTDQVHSNGMILSGALWDIRSDPRIPPATADSLVLRALDYLPALMDFGCIADACWQANADFFDSRYMVPILLAFLNRGIWLSTNCPGVIEGPSPAYANIPASYVARLPCDLLPTEYTWYKRPCVPGDSCYGSWGEPLETERWNPSVTVRDSDDFELKLVIDHSFRGHTQTTRRIIVYTGPDPTAKILVPPTCRGTYEAEVGGLAPFTYEWATRPTTTIHWQVRSLEPTMTLEIRPFGVRLRVQDSEVPPRRVTVFKLNSELCPGTIAGSANGAWSTEPIVGDRTEIRFHASAGTYARIDVIDIAGRIARRIYEGPLEDGENIIQWGAQGIPSGVYFYRLEMDGRTLSRRVVILR